jgi:hypothetical protein
VKRLLFVSTVAIVGSLTALAACKQGQGDRCQVNDDCDNGLVCNKAKNTCQSSSGGDLDASVIDAVPADAAPDAPDAMPDAP